MSEKKSKPELWDVDRIHPYELNAKIHDEKQVEKIAASIKKFGWRGNPIVVNEEGVILAGHGRRLAAIKLGLPKVPVEVVSGLSEDEQRAYRLADNRVAISDIDSGLLQKELSSLDFDLDGIFDKKELAFLEADLGDFNEESFVDDIEVEVGKQAAESAKKVEETDAADVKIDKALGFKTVKTADERHIVRFMAQIEADTGLTGSEAFVSFVRSVMAE